MNNGMFCSLVRATLSLGILATASLTSAEPPELVPRFFAQSTNLTNPLPIDWMEDEDAKLIVSLPKPEDPNVVTATQRIVFANAEHAPWGITQWTQVRMLLAHEGGLGNQGAWFVPEDEVPPVGANAKVGPDGDVIDVELYFVRLCEAGDTYPGGPCDSSDVTNKHYIVTDNPIGADFVFQIGLTEFSK